MLLCNNLTACSIWERLTSSTLMIVLKYFHIHYLCHCGNRVSFFHNIILVISLEEEKKRKEKDEGKTRGNSREKNDINKRTLKSHVCNSDYMTLTKLRGHHFKLHRLKKQANKRTTKTWSKMREREITSNFSKVAF